MADQPGGAHRASKENHQGWMFVLLTALTSNKFESVPEICGHRNPGPDTTDSQLCKHILLRPQKPEVCLKAMFPLGAQEAPSSSSSHDGLKCPSLMATSLRSHWSLFHLYICPLATFVMGFWTHFEPGQLHLNLILYFAETLFPNKAVFIQRLRG